MKEEFILTDAKTMAYINMFAVLGALENLVELDNKAREILHGSKNISVGFEVKGGPSATFHFTSSSCKVEQGITRCDVKLPFSSCEKFNGLIDGTTTPIPSKGFTKIGFLLKKFIPLTDRLSEVLRPSPEAIQDPRFFETSTVLTFNTIAAAISQIGNHDDLGTASASYMLDGDIMMSIKDGPKATIRVKSNQLTTIKKEPENPRAIMEFGSLELAYDLFTGKVNALACVGDGTIEMKGMISMIDNMNRMLDRVAVYLA